jgi:hypothetical protein
MKFLLSESYGNTLTQAFTTAMKRGILPTWMGSAELDALELAIKERAVFSARTTNAVYLEALHEKIGRLLTNGYDGDQAKLRLELKQLLAELAYNPETGFPGDAALGIPAARAGSLQDLSSDKRINLILDTQLELMAGKGQEQRGLSKEALDLFPAWELVRIKEARVPRDWFTRFKQAGGRVLEDADGRKRLVAHKLDEVWSVLGDRALFKDALDVSHPPFAFGSGMAWQAIEQAEWDLLAGTKNKEPSTQNLPANVIQFPSAQVSTDGLSAETLKRLKATMQNAEAKGGKLTLKSIIGTAPPPPSSSRLNALCDELLSVAMVAEINGKARKAKRAEQQAKLPGQKCGNTWIPAWKECHQGKAVEMSRDKAVKLLSSEQPMTTMQAAEALRAAPHHHLRETLRHWFDKSFARLNQQAGSKETQSLKTLIDRIEPTPHAGELYRGLRFQSREKLAEFSAQAVKGTLTQPLNAFSKRAAVAHRFSKPHSTDAGQFNAIIRLIGSKSGRDMRPLADVTHPKVSHQDEFIFLAGTKVKVLGKRYDPTTEGGTFVLDLEEL